tara:strand:- start:28944 stop:29708 length:765 start_codon:yes stop_codon:yes gene_type:complete
MRKRFLVLLVILAAGWIVSNRHDVVDFLARERDPTKRSQSAAKRVRPLISAELSRLNLKMGEPIFIRIFKETRELEVWVQPTGSNIFIFYKTYLICSDLGDLGPKRRERDGDAPEGFYWIAPRHMDPGSKYHLSFNIGFPNQYDRQQRWSGNPVLVHGGCKRTGGFGLGNNSIEEVFTLATSALNNGQEFFRVHIFPFRMTDQRMNRALADLEVSSEGKELLDFWANLKIGYDYFEIVGKPPFTSLKNGKYVFE